MTLDTALRSAASAVLRATGSTVTIRRVTPGTYSTATGTQTPTPSDTVLKGRLDMYEDRELSPSILAGDRRLIVASGDVGYNPEPQKDVVVIGSRTYDIVRVVTHRGQDLDAVYELQIRR